MLQLFLKLTMLRKYPYCYFGEKFYVTQVEETFIRIILIR